MLRIFLFLLIVLLLGFGFAWFADRPGEVALQWQGNTYKTSLMVVLVAMVAITAAIMITWWLLRSVLDSPRIVQRFFARRKRDQGYQALTRGLIAANSGDTAAARRYAKESNRLLGEGPLVGLLDAQTLLLEGDRDTARSRFEAMLEDDETKLVGLRGLYVEAERQGAREAARHYAERAHEQAPSLAWAANAKLRYSSMAGDWDGALATLEANRSAGLLSKEDAKRQRAVLLTAQAMSEEPADPAKAAKLAREAHRLAPALVPAAVIGAKALMRNNDIGRAAGMIEKVWKLTPHPELADAYIHLRLGDSATDRLKRARKLAAMRANHTESSFAIAQAAIDAQEWKLARDTLKGVLLTAPSERACLMMADIEEAEHGDKGRMRDWLARAVRAPRDPAWTADGYVSEKWLPFSPVTGRIDAFEWKQPVEQLGAPSDVPVDADGIEELMTGPPVAPVASEPDALPETTQGVPDETLDSATVDADGFPDEASRSPSGSGEKDEGDGATRAEAETGIDRAGAEDVEPVKEVAAASGGADRDSEAGKEAEETETDVAHEPETESVNADGKAKEKDGTEDRVLGFGRAPDDPGVSDDEPEPERCKRFGIF